MWWWTTKVPSGKMIFLIILHEDGFTIAGITVDINPITEDKMGSLAEYLESVVQFLQEKMQEKNWRRGQ